MIVFVIGDGTDNIVEIQHRRSHVGVSPVTLKGRFVVVTESVSVTICASVKKVGVEVIVVSTLTFQLAVDGLPTMREPAEDMENVWTKINVIVTGDGGVNSVEIQLPIELAGNFLTTTLVCAPDTVLASTITCVNVKNFGLETIVRSHFQDSRVVDILHMTTKPARVTVNA